MSENFAERIAGLEALLNETEKQVSSEERCMPTMVIAGAVVPLVILLLLFFIKPSFVTRKEGKRKIRDGKKIAAYTAVATLVIWAAMYFFSKSRGGSDALTCQR